MSLLTFFNWLFGTETDIAEDSYVDFVNILFDEAYFSNFPEYFEVG